MFQLILDNFWKRWTKEYLPTLQPRQKWLHSKQNLAVGDLVLLLDSGASRGLWPKARVEKVFPGKDGLVRTVQVRTSDGSYMRDIRKLCLLEGA